jgi:ABC-type glycerol-3-phosphate transport system substrate-binding protein
MQEVLNENLALALNGDKTAKEALDDTQADWLEILAE